MVPNKARTLNVFMRSTTAASYALLLLARIFPTVTPVNLKVAPITFTVVMEADGGLISSDFLTLI